MSLSTRVFFGMIAANFAVMLFHKRRFSHPYLLIFMALAFLTSLTYIHPSPIYVLTFFSLLLADVLFSNYLQFYMRGMMLFLSAHVLYAAYLYDTTISPADYALVYVPFSLLMVGAARAFYFSRVADIRMRLTMAVYAMVASIPVSLSIVNAWHLRSASSAIIGLGSLLFAATDHVVAYDLAYSIDRKNLTWGLYVPAILCWNIGPHL